MAYDEQTFDEAMVRERLRSQAARIKGQYPSASQNDTMMRSVSGYGKPVPPASPTQTVSQPNVIGTRSPNAMYGEYPPPPPYTQTHVAAPTGTQAASVVSGATQEVAVSPGQRRAALNARIATLQAGIPHTRYGSVERAQLANQIRALRRESTLLWEIGQSRSPKFLDAEYAAKASRSLDEQSLAEIDRRIGTSTAPITPERLREAERLAGMKALYSGGRPDLVREDPSGAFQRQVGAGGAAAELGAESKMRLAETTRLLERKREIEDRLRSYEDGSYKVAYEDRKPQRQAALDRYGESVAGAKIESERLGSERIARDKEIETERAMRQRVLEAGASTVESQATRSMIESEKAKQELKNLQEGKGPEARQRELEQEQAGVSQFYRSAGFTDATTLRKTYEDRLEPILSMFENSSGNGEVNPRLSWGATPETIPESYLRDFETQILIPLEQAMKYSPQEARMIAREIMGKLPGTGKDGSYVVPPSFHLVVDMDSYRRFAGTLDQLRARLYRITTGKGTAPEAL